MKKLLLTILVATFIGSNVQADEWTGFQSVDLVDTTGNVQETLVIPVGNAWGAPGCPNAAFVVLDSSLASYKEMLASILTAKAAGFKVRFFGDCAAHPFFTAEKLRIQ